MAYSETNFKTKKAFKDALAAYKAGQGPALYLFQPGLGTIPENGRIAVEGPHYPKPHSWYAVVTMKDGKVDSIK
jgi:hypothetical protein